MSTLLLRLAGPMQSWGTQSRFTIRDTGLEPSKSGVIGLLCAALGRPRDADLADLAALRMGVRIDRPGVPRVEYQTAGGTHRRGESYGVAQVGGGMRTVVSRRYYLADADFLVGLEPPDGDDTLLRQLDRALARSVWPLFLGRKSYLPGVPVRLPDDAPEGPGLRSERLDGALRAYPWPRKRHDGDAAPPDRLRLVIDATPEENDPTASYDIRTDLPLSFVSARRRFATRRVRTDWITEKTT